MGWDTSVNGTDMSYMRFSPTDFTIRVGDTIEWTQTSALAPHTVSLTSGGQEPDVTLITPQQQGPPRIELNPAVLTPAGGTSYDGRGFFSSGYMPGTQDPASGPRKYSLTFTRPGTYEYICILHDEMGMNGRITVLAGTAVAPGMPTTGNPALSRLDMALVLALAGATCLTLAGLMLRRRQKGQG